MSHQIAKGIALEFPEDFPLNLSRDAHCISRRFPMKFLKGFPLDFYMISQHISKGIPLGRIFLVISKWHPFGFPGVVPSDF